MASTLTSERASADQQATIKKLQVELKRVT